MNGTLKKHDPDRALVLACQTNDPSSLDGPFREIFERYSSRVFTICHDLTGNLQDASDAAQETFSTVFRRMGTFRGESKFSSWLYRIASNAAIDIRRSARNKRPLSLDRMRESVDNTGARGISLPDDSAEQPFEPVARQEQSRDVHRAIQGLSEKLREVVLLRYFEGLPYEDISVRLGLSIGTVKSRLFRAHESLEYWLAPTQYRHSA